MPPLSFIRDRLHTQVRFSDMFGGSNFFTSRQDRRYAVSASSKEAISEQVTNVEQYSIVVIELCNLTTFS